MTPQNNSSPSRVSQDLRKKLDVLREKGIDPYPSNVKRTHKLGAVENDFSKLSQVKKKLIVAGRLRSLRRHGGSTFGNLEDETGSLQILIRKDEIGEDGYSLLDNVDLGDFLEITGRAMKTKRGEKTIEASSLRILCKVLQPLPEKWHGLKDLEARRRQRYLDLIANPEVRDRFKIRSRIVEELRRLLLTKDYLEVETPILQPLYGGAQAKPFKTQHNALGIPLYLRISDELYLKRLIVGGYERVFEFCRDFRNEGIDQYHNPEFTQLEVMTAYQDYRYAMDLVSEAYEVVAKKVLGQTRIEYQGEQIELARPWKRVTMLDAVKEVTGQDWSQIENLEEAQKLVAKIKLNKEQLAESRKIKTVGELLAFVFAEKVEETLIQPTIVHDYPVEISPLAKRCSDNPRFVERFEHFVAGHEQGDNWTELNDPIDLRARFEEEANREKEGFDEAHKTDEDFLTATEYGLPPTTGIGIGIDRMTMLFTNTSSIRDVIIFPTLRPKS